MGLCATQSLTELGFEGRVTNAVLGPTWVCVPRLRAEQSWVLKEARVPNAVLGPTWVCVPRLRAEQSWALPLKAELSMQCWDVTTWVCVPRLRAEQSWALKAEL